MWTKILEIDLSHKSFRILEEEELFHQAMGGTALATRLLERYGDPTGDPLGPNNPVILAIGPFSNILPIATKTTALFKSPHTGELGESHAGGRLAMAIYNAGFGALVIRGASSDPVVLDIDENQVIFRSARALWGQSASATERILRARDWAQPGKKSILRIGPAGERLSTYACATVDTQRHFGRLGLGAVLGAKKLKALVIGGNRYQKITNKKKFKGLYDGIYEAVVSSGVMRKYHAPCCLLDFTPIAVRARRTVGHECPACLASRCISDVETGPSFNSSANHSTASLSAPPSVSLAIAASTSRVIALAPHTMRGTSFLASMV